jgi:hypothetical protein
MINQRVLEVLGQCSDKGMTVLHWERSAHRDWVDIEQDEEGHDNVLDDFSIEYEDDDPLLALLRSRNVERKQKSTPYRSRTGYRGCPTNCWSSLLGADEPGFP